MQVTIGYKTFGVTKGIFTALHQHLMTLPTLVATSNKIWFNNWSKTEKMKDYLWHRSLTHFCALRYLFQASCRPSQDCKKQSWTSDGKVINCVVACACVSTVEEFMRLLVPDACRTCSPGLNHTVPLFHLSSLFSRAIESRQRRRERRKEETRPSRRCGVSINTLQCISIYPCWCLTHPGYVTWRWDFSHHESFQLTLNSLNPLIVSLFKFKTPAETSPASVCPWESLNLKLKSDTAYVMSALYVVHLWPLAALGHRTTHLLQQVSMSCGIS